MPAPKNTQTDAEYIAERIKINEEGCWIWQRSTQSGGYGQAHRHGKYVLVHRLSYAAHVGPIPKGAVVHHVCHVKVCCNPEHLTAVTHHENIAESHYDRALTDELLNSRNDYAELREMYDKLKEMHQGQHTIIAEMQGIAKATYETHNETVADYMTLFRGVDIIATLFDGLMISLSAAPTFEHLDHAGNYEVDPLDPFELITWFEAIADWKPEMFSLVPPEGFDEDFDEDEYEDEGD